MVPAIWVGAILVGVAAVLAAFIPGWRREQQSGEVAEPRLSGAGARLG
jgi:hypothetical protein